MNAKITINTDSTILKWKKNNIPVHFPVMKSFFGNSIGYYQDFDDFQPFFLLVEK